jgi:hypothetical protein
MILVPMLFFSHIQQARLSVEDGLATFVEHIAVQISLSIADLKQPAAERKLWQLAVAVKSFF